MTDYDYDDVDNPQPPIELARKRLTDYITEWGDGVVDSVQYDFRNGNSHDLHTRDIGAYLETLDRISNLHTKYTYSFGLEICTTCGEEQRWPCDTIRLARGLDPDGELR